MTREEIDTLWFQAQHDAIKAGEDFTRYRFAALVAAAERTRMISEGWRQCAQGQRTTQFCGMVEQERNRACRIVTGLCISDNNAQEICDAIRARGQESPEDNPSF